MKELKSLYNKPDEKVINDIADQLKTAAKDKESFVKFCYLDSNVNEYFRGIGFMVESYWDKDMDCQATVFSGWDSDDN